MKNHARINVATIMALFAIAGQAHENQEARLQPTEQPWESGATIVTLSQDGVLRVSGKGAMMDYGWYYTRGSGSPWESAIWHNVAPPITAVVIEDGVTHIGNNAFAMANHMVSVTIPNSVTSIGDGAFYYCTRLNAVTIPDSVTSIGKDAYRESGLTSVTIPSNVTVIKDRTFYGCVSLTSVTIPGHVISIGEGAFFNAGLTSVTIEDGVEVIGFSAFSRCTSLTSITIPSSVTSLESMAFGECTNLKLISIQCPVPPRFGGNAFYGVPISAKLCLPRKSRKAYLYEVTWQELLHERSPKKSGLRTLAIILTTIIVLVTVTFTIIKKSRKSLATANG